MRRKLTTLLALLLVAVNLAGCMRITGVIDTTKSAKKYITTATILYNKAKIDALAQGDMSSLGDAAASSDQMVDSETIQEMMTGFQQYPVVTVDGVEYYSQQGDKDKEAYYNEKTYKKGEQIITTKSIYASDVASMDVNGQDTQFDDPSLANFQLLEKMIIEVRFKDKVVKTNGRKLNGGKTVQFIFTWNDLAKKKKMEIYAYTKSADHTLKGDRKISKGNK